MDALRSSTHALLERDNQLHVLDATLDEAAGGHGRTVVLEGPAGAGKTALLEAASEMAARRGLLTLTARGSEIEQEFAFGLARQLLEPALAAAGDGRQDELLAGPAAPAALAVAPGQEVEHSRPPDSFAVMHALFVLLGRLAAERPVLLGVDDAHWGDASSLRALSYLAGRIASVPVALVVSTRPNEPGAPEALLDRLRAEPAVQRLTAQPLGPRAVAEVVRTRLPTADAGACRAAAEATAGNPLYLAELLRAVEDDGAVDDAAASIQRAALPSLGDRVARRIARVDPDAPALASAMAVIGDGGRLAVAAELARVDPAAAGSIVHRLQRIEVLAAEDPFAFVHPLVRRSVYDALSAADRDRAHLRAAELLEAAGARPQAVAAHRAALTPRGAPETAEAMARAAADAQARGAPDEAARWYARALDEGAPRPTRPELLAKLGFSRVALLDPAGIPHLQEALRLSDDPLLSAQIGITLAPALFASGQWDEAAEVLAASQQALGDRDPAAAAELAGIGLMVTGLARALADKLPQDEQRLEELTAAPGWGPHALAAMRASMAAHRGAPAERVQALVDRAVESGVLLDDPGHAVWATSALQIALAEIDEHERGLEVSARMRAASERQGSINSLLSADSHAAWILARRGDLAEAGATLVPLIAQAQATGNPTFVASQLFYLLDALLERSGLEQTAAIAEDLDLDAAGLAGTWMEAMVRIVRGRLRVGRLDRRGGLADLRAAQAIAAGLSIAPTVAPTRSLVALALPPSQRDEADALIEEELELAHASGLARPRALALRAAGVLAEPADGVELLREATALLQSCGARVEEARTLLELGSALRRAGSRVEARTELSRGAALARACGADLLGERLGEELRAAGGRPRRTDTSGPGALTASELRVARMAASGASTPEIAQALVVSAKTVETHLTHAYAKLGLSGPGARGRLAEALGAEG